MAVAQIDRLRIDHNVWQGSIKGMVIDVGFTVQGMMGQQGEVSTYFNYWQGGPLKDFDNAYRTADGHVAAYTDFMSQSINEAMGVQLFMPYSQLDMAPGLGEVALMCAVSIWDKSRPVAQELVRSPWYEFVYYQ